MFNRMRTGAWTGIVALVAAFALSSCSIQPVAKDFALEGNSNMGVVYLSLTRVGSLESSMWLKLRGVNRSYSGFIALDDHGVARDWAKITRSDRVNDFGKATVEAPIGYLAAFALPPGEYEFYAWYGTSPVWMEKGDDYDIKSQDFSVKFTVKANTVTYAGNLQVTIPDDVSADAIKGNFQLAVSDQQARDQAVLRQKYPNLGGKSAETSVMVAANAGQTMTYWVWPGTGPTRNGGGGFGM